ncbi:hypothetical protein FJZ31_28295 [Candidatus Poribacteria bacterium]|nr:hypothetical protein [Candidatus Poribacteria bacterium]
MYTPFFKNPVEEFKRCVATLKKMLNNLHDYNGMEIENYLSCRDGIEWAIGKLTNHKNLFFYLAEVNELDEKIRKNAQYILSQMDNGFIEDYRQMFNIPKKWWWWYLDEYTMEAEK